MSKAIESAHQEMFRSLTEVSVRLEREIVPEAGVLAAQSGIAFVAAPIKGLEEVPATRYVEGVEFAVAYLDLQVKKLSPGFYILQGVIYEPKIGEVPA